MGQTDGGHVLLAQEYTRVCRDTFVRREDSCNNSSPIIGCMALCCMNCLNLLETVHPLAAGGESPDAYIINAVGGCCPSMAHNTG